MGVSKLVCSHLQLRHLILLSWTKEPEVYPVPRHGSRSNHPFNQSDRSIKTCPKYLFTTACATDLILTTISKMENDVTWFRDINSSLIVAERQINTVLFKLHKNTRKLDWTRTGLVRCLFVDNRFVIASSPLYFIALVLPSKQISRLTLKVAPVQLPATIIACY